MVACAAITILCLKQVSHFLFLSCSILDKVLHAVLLLLVVTLALKKEARSSFGLEIRPQSVFTAIRALLHFASYSVE
jgi:hypothetical protein